jgi:acyl carrier protein
MTSKEEIFTKIQHVLTETFEIDAAAITPETHLFDELDLDSFDAVDLAVTLEVETGIKLKEEDIRPIRTIADVVDTIHTKMHEASNIEH